MTTTQDSLVGSAPAKGRTVSVVLWRWVRRLERRATRGTRFALAVRALRTRMNCLPENRWDMTDAEDVEYTRLHDGVFRDYARLQKLGERWGYHLP